VTSKLAFLPAKVDECGPAVFDHGPHRAGLGIGLDHQVARRIIAKVFDLAVGPGQRGSRFGLSCSNATGVERSSIVSLPAVIPGTATDSSRCSRRRPEES
jgi:hypothetical protein